MDSVSIRVPYKNLRKSEVELVGFDDDHAHHTIELNSRVSNGNHININNSNSSVHNGDNVSDGSSSTNEPDPISMKALVLSCMVAAGVQFGWALQLSLLTPYIQTLGIQHAFSSFIWLCGPITGLVVQPCVGIWSDRCYSKYGRRRPYILLGSLMISVAVIIIGFSADIGYYLGDSKESCSTYRGTRTMAAIVFVIGFWMLDLANNTVQGPARALLADLAGSHQRNSANAIFCSWMAVGNILGFSSGASGKWLSWFPFLTTKACCEACGNLKGAFLVAVVFLTFCTLVTLYFAKEIPLAKPVHRLSDSAPLLDGTQESGIELSKSHSSNSHDGHGPRVITALGVLDPSRDSEVKEDQIEKFNNSPGAVLVNLLTSMRHLPPSMHSVLLVMALSWLSWFPFFLFDTDWMGREVYHGDPNGDEKKIRSYNDGVQEGALGLLLNSVVLGVSSFLIEPMCKRIGSRLVWSMSNFTVFACMAGIAVISMFSVREYTEGIQHAIDGSKAVRIAALVVFSLLGFPLAITYSVPFSVTAELTADSGGGQGLAIGVLNLAIVVPQMIVSLGAGPWDALFGGGNVPAFVLASIFALAGGIIAKMKLPNLNSYQSSGFHMG